MHIGFVGLGKMGSVMAPHLATAQYQVTGFDLNTAIDVSAPVSKAACLAELGDCDVIITMLPEGDVVLKAVDELLSAGCKALFIDMSSCHPEIANVMQTRLSKKGLDFIDAPVSGGVARARTAELMIMTGGDKDIFQKAEPILSMMGTALHVGPAGAGYAMKALNNYVSAAGLVTSFQALATAQNFGIQPEQFQKVINASTGRNNTTEVKIDKFVLTQAFNSGFALALMAKDVSIASDIIEQNSFDVPVTRALSSYLFNALEDLGAEADHTEIFKHVTHDKSH